MAAAAAVHAIAFWIAACRVAARARMPLDQTRARVAQETVATMGTMLRRFASDHPKSPLIRAGDPVNANAGAEAVLAAFAAANWSFSPTPEIDDTDGDGRDEFVDPWGNPYVYFDAADYDAAVAGVVYVRGDGARVTVRPRRDPDTTWHFQLIGFQLFSMGPDEVPGTSDDVVEGVHHDR
jgi:hypothetical protein